MSKNENKDKEPIAKAELFDNGDDSYQLVAYVRLGGVKFEIDRSIDLGGDSKKRGGHLRQVK